MWWNFPPINPLKKFTIKHYADHISSEIEEFNKEETGSVAQAKEVIDILHAAETLVRKFFEKHPQHDVSKVRQQVIRKNDERGYYCE